jgi:thiamine-phosphate pyrophosphorylase
MVQYRAKALEPGLALVQARSLASLCREFGVPFIVNDSLPLALACDADGVHVGRDDAGVREARIAMPRAIVGASCYADPRLAARAAAEGADYVAIGSVFASSTKPAASRAPLELLAAAAAASGGLPVVAIGGITPHNAPAAVAAGADLLAVISAVFDAPDVRAAAEAFTRLYATKSGDRDVRPQPRPL